MGLVPSSGVGVCSGLVGGVVCWVFWFGVWLVGFLGGCGGGFLRGFFGFFCWLGWVLVWFLDGWLVLFGVFYLFCWSFWFGVCVIFRVLSLPKVMEVLPLAYTGLWGY